MINWNTDEAQPLYCTPPLLMSQLALLHHTNTARISKYSKLEPQAGFFIAKFCITSQAKKAC